MHEKAKESIKSVISSKKGKKTERHGQIQYAFTYFAYEMHA